MCMYVYNIIFIYIYVCVYVYVYVCLDSTKSHLVQFEYLDTWTTWSLLLQGLQGSSNGIH
jgi:hypothetical protein